MNYTPILNTLNFKFIINTLKCLNKYLPSEY